MNTPDEATNDAALKGIQKAFRSLLSQKRFYGKTAPEYGVIARRMSPDGHEISVDIVFKSGVRYCCTEVGCHIALRSMEQWERLHSALRACNVDVVRPLIVHLRTVIEANSFIMVKWEQLDSGEYDCAFIPNTPYVADHDFDESDLW